MIKTVFKLLNLWQFVTQQQKKDTYAFSQLSLLFNIQIVPLICNVVTSVTSSAKKEKGRTWFKPSRNPTIQPERQVVTKQVLQYLHYLPQIEKGVQEESQPQEELFCLMELEFCHLTHFQHHIISSISTNTALVEWLEINRTCKQGIILKDQTGSIT